MFNPVLKISLAFFELLGCIACVITKIITDQEARRVLLQNRKLSKEWSLLNNITWSTEGNAFAIMTYGGFTIITAVFLISRLLKRRVSPTLSEKIFLIVGLLFFMAMGGLVFASLDQVHSELFDNTIILGSLSFLVAVLFLIDLLDPMARFSSGQTQTDRILDRDLNSKITQLNSVEKDRILNISSNMEPVHILKSDHITPNGYYFEGDKVDIAHTNQLPTSQQPVFAQLLLPEKKVAIKNKIQEPVRLKVEHKVQPQDRYFTNNTNSFDNGKHANDINNRAGCVGFVAQAAKMWEKRSNRKAFVLNTIV